MKYQFNELYPAAAKLIRDLLTDPNYEFSLPEGLDHYTQGNETQVYLAVKHKNPGEVLRARNVITVYFTKGEDGSYAQSNMGWDHPWEKIAE